MYDRPFHWRPVLVRTICTGCIMGSVILGRLAAQTCTTVRVSESSQGAQGQSHSGIGPFSMSADGRYVAFESDAANLVPGDTNGMLDAFVHDRIRGTTVRVSVSSTGVQGSSTGSPPSISPNGRFVAFQSTATTLVRDKILPTMTTYVHDLHLGTTERLPIQHTNETNLLSGADHPRFSDDGRYVAFTSSRSGIVAGVPPQGWTHVYVHDRWTGLTEVVSVNSRGELENKPSYWDASISADGRYVAFATHASNVAPGNPMGWSHVYVHDRHTRLTERVSLSSLGQEPNEASVSPAISPDGRLVAFHSLASNLVPGDTNGQRDCFVHDRITRQTELVSVGLAGAPADGESFSPFLSEDGRYVSVWSEASNLVEGDTNDCADIFVRDRQAGTTVRASLAWDGSQAINESGVSHAISWDGQRVAFYSHSTNLVPGKTSWYVDVFVRDCGWPLPSSYCTGRINSAGCVPRMDVAGMPSASAGGGFEVSARDVLNGTAGRLHYSIAGPQAAPFLGGWLCLQRPLSGTPVQLSGGATGPPFDCSGTFTLDFNRWIALGGDPTLVPGQTVWTQYFGRDPALPAAVGVQLTDGMRFEIQP